MDQNKQNVNINNTTKELVLKSQKGDIKAFEGLVTTYQGKVFGLCLRLAGNPDDAEDLAQEVFIKAFNSLRGFRLEADFGTWLHRITVNLWINISKKNSKVVQISIDEPVATKDGELHREIADSGTAGNPLLALEEVEFRSTIKQALETLSIEQRTVLVLRDIDGYSYEEIAVMTGCSLGTVKSRINRARQAMRDKLS